MALPVPRAGGRQRSAGSDELVGAGRGRGADSWRARAAGDADGGRGRAAVGHGHAGLSRVGRERRWGQGGLGSGVGGDRRVWG